MAEVGSFKCCLWDVSGSFRSGWQCWSVRLTALKSEQELATPWRGPRGVSPTWGGTLGKRNTWGNPEVRKERANTEAILSKWAWRVGRNTLQQVTLPGRPRGFGETAMSPVAVIFNTQLTRHTLQEFHTNSFPKHFFILFLKMSGTTYYTLGMSASPQLPVWSFVLPSLPPISLYFMCIFTLTQIVSAPGHPFLQTSSLPALLPLQVKLIIFHCSITFINDWIFAMLCLELPAVPQKITVLFFKEI